MTLIYILFIKGVLEGAEFEGPSGGRRGAIVDSLLRVPCDNVTISQAYHSRKV